MKRLESVKLFHVVLIKSKFLRWPEFRANKGFQPKNNLYKDSKNGVYLFFVSLPKSSAFFLNIAANGISTCIFTGCNFTQQGKGKIHDHFFPNSSCSHITDAGAKYQHIPFNK